MVCASHILPICAGLAAVSEAMTIPKFFPGQGDAHNNTWNEPWAGCSDLDGRKVVYTMSNVCPNSLIAMAASGSGMLSPDVTYTSTGGNGSNLVNAMTGKPSQPDALSSADSVVVAGDYVFNVNAGSNTVSMFAIDPKDPMSPMLLGEPQDSRGVFPVAVAVSMLHKMVCVANTGVTAGVACASFDPFAGLSPFDALRPFDVGQTQTPPVGPVPGVGDMIFNWDESILAVFAKGDGEKVKGFVETYTVYDNGSVSQTGTSYHPPGLDAEFGSSNIPNAGNLVLSSQANFGAVVLDLDDLTATPMAKTNVTGQGASCWAQVSSFTGTGFITDPTINRLVETNLTSGAIVSEYYPPNYNIGMTDFRIAGSQMWLLAAGNGTTPPSICVIDISGGPGSAKQVQNYAVPSSTANLQGMAVYEKWWI